MQKTIFGLVFLTTVASAQAAQTTPVPDIAPPASGQQVVINVPQQRLFFYQDGKLKKVYPVAVGKAMTQTNLGVHKIGAKAFNPTWHIPKSIQRERGDGVQTVPPGPKNPLGPVFVRLGNPKLGLGIHGTNNPSSVPGVRSHGCVRMKSPDALEFAKTVHTGTTAIVSYEMVALNQDAAGHLWLAAFKDPYNKKSLKTAKLHAAISAWAQAHGQTISAASVNAVLRAKTAQPVCLTCAGKKGKIQGDLQSIAWNSGSYELTLPQGAMSSRPSTPTQDEVLPEGSEIEIDAEAELDKFQGSSVFDDNAPVATPARTLKPLNNLTMQTATQTLPEKRVPPTNTNNPLTGEVELKPINSLF